MRKVSLLESRSFSSGSATILNAVKPPLKDKGKEERGRKGGKGSLLESRSFLNAMNDDRTKRTFSKTLPAATGGTHPRRPGARAHPHGQRRAGDGIHLPQPGQRIANGERIPARGLAGGSSPALLENLHQRGRAHRHAHGRGRRG